MEYTELTPMQKLQAMAEKHYNYQPWTPKLGDYYTSSRADLELYKIVDEDEKHLYTVYCNIEDWTPDQWVKEDFLKEFGRNRVHVNEWILKQK